jgi:hemoglobin-like flavoprotein
MDSKQKDIVRQTFAKLEPVAEKAAELFYERLFQIEPSVRPLFKGDMNEQGRKLMATLGLAVRSLERLEQLVPALEEMGRRHAAAGVKDEHYDTVGEALLGTLEQGLGTDWAPDVKLAWSAAYGALAAAMKKGAADAAAANRGIAAVLAL